jgi:hypothetical protein
MLNLLAVFDNSHYYCMEVKRRMIESIGQLISNTLQKGLINFQNIFLKIVLLEMGLMNFLDKFTFILSFH